MGHSWRTGSSAALCRRIRGAFFSQDKRHVFTVSRDGVCVTWKFELEGYEGNEGGDEVRALQDV